MRHDGYKELFIAALIVKQTSFWSFKSSDGEGKGLETIFQTRNFSEI